MHSWITIIKYLKMNIINIRYFWISIDLVTTQTRMYENRSVIKENVDKYLIADNNLC